MKAVILAGGFGTRISEESQFKPKPMLEIGEMPVINSMSSKSGSLIISCIRLILRSILQKEMKSSFMINTPSSGRLQ